MAAGAPLRLTLLGGFALQQGGQEVGIGAGGQRLVAFLALRDRPLRRLHVAGTLWPDYSPARSLAVLRTTLWRVNQSGRRVVTATPSHLGLHPDIEVDVRELTAFARRLNASAAGPTSIDLDTVGLGELSGDLLPDWYDEWLQHEGEALRQTRLHALETLAGALSAAGRHADAIQAALTAIHLEPLRETAHRTLIETHLAEGNWSEARRQFHRCRRLLREELEVEPSESLRRLFEEKPRPHGQPARRRAPDVGIGAVVLAGCVPAR
jgi:DNA-binding SARP family transcriptional activator